MNQADPVVTFEQTLQAQDIPVQLDEQDTLWPARKIKIAPDHWGAAAEVAAQLGWRWAGLWGDAIEQHASVYVCFALESAYCVIQTQILLDENILTSHTAWYPGANRLERHASDLLGILFAGHPQSQQRWTRHQAWDAQSFPLRADFPIEGINPKRTPADKDYPFTKIEGSGVYEIPVGPVHAGIIEPGHFRFQAMGEKILNLEERLGYVHKGIEKQAVGRDPAGLVKLAARISGDTTVAHSWAACQAMERATNAQVPTRALFIRGLLAERERVANHIGDIGAICNDVGFAFMHAQCANLREQWQRRNKAVFGHRLLMDTLIPGGVVQDLSQSDIDCLIDDHQTLREAVAPLFDILEDHPSLEDRLLGTGFLSQEDAQDLGCTGYVAKASGLDFDVRKNASYAPYDGLNVKVAVQSEGDVAARIQVRARELLTSLSLMDQWLEQMPTGAVSQSMPAAEKHAMGMGFIEAWRGEIITFVRFDQFGRIERFFPRDPSWFLWPALEQLIDGNIVPDFPVCNKSVNGSYSGHDL